MTAVNEQQLPVVTDVISGLKHKPGALLPILHEIQNRLGFIPAESVPLIAEALTTLGVGYHGTTSDQNITLEEVYCLGNCACSPSIRINDEIVGRVTPEKFDQLIDELRSQPLEVH